MPGECDSGEGPSLSPGPAPSAGTSGRQELLRWGDAAFRVLAATKAGRGDFEEITDSFPKCAVGTREEKTQHRLGIRATVWQHMFCFLHLATLRSGAHGWGSGLPFHMDLFVQPLCTVSRVAGLQFMHTVEGCRLKDCPQV